MKLNLVHLLCLIGIPYVLSINNLTQIGPILIMQPVTWPEAQNYCREHYIDLFTVENQNDQVELIKEMNKYKEIGPAWTGLYIDLDNWYWSYNHLPLKNISLNRWAVGEPNNAYGEYVCGGIDNQGSWSTLPCFVQGPYICYDANRSPANRFVAYGSPVLTWSAAQAFCRLHHTDLASSITAADITLLEQALASISWTGALFGLTRDTWKWSDGTEPVNLPWAIGQPDNLNTWENCAAAQNGLLGDEKCTNPYYFVCSAYRFKKTQIVKIKVKSDTSVFDPAVQSSILELMKQKLQANSTLVRSVAWRVQPNGSIFYKKDCERPQENVTQSHVPCGKMQANYTKN